MEYFKKYFSNTYAGSGNQLYFGMDEDEVRTGRIFYKITAGGKFDYSLLFSNTIDSTYEDGSISQKNLICDEWMIHSAKVGKCRYIPGEKELCEMTVSDMDDADITVFDLRSIYFDKKISKHVMPGEFFYSDPIELEFESGEYLCLEITFSGRMIPYHEESLLPVFIKEKGKWQYSKLMPFASMIGCNRKIEKRIGYLGDSITQGVGTRPNSYRHWNALLSEKIGDKNAYWNLGIGYGMASDAASDGAWLFKAKQNDIIFVCYGVNDILRGRSEEQIKSDLTRIIDLLKKEGKKVILQTVPPFDYKEEDIEKWRRINTYINTVLKEKVDLLFDNTHILGKDEMSLHMAKYGGHPDEAGCELWADKLFEELGDL